MFPRTTTGQLSSSTRRGDVTAADSFAFTSPTIGTRGRPQRGGGGGGGGGSAATRNSSSGTTALRCCLALVLPLLALASVGFMASTADLRGLSSSDDGDGARGKLSSRRLPEIQQPLGADSHIPSSPFVLSPLPSPSSSSSGSPLSLPRALELLSECPANTPWGEHKRASAISRPILSTSSKASDTAAAAAVMEEEAGDDEGGGGEELVIACIGDSITFGNATHKTLRHGKGNGGGNYPKELAKLFAAAAAQPQRQLLADGIVPHREDGNTHHRTTKAFDPQHQHQGEEGEGARHGRGAYRYSSIVAYNFGVGGRTATISHKLGYDKTPEYKLAKRLLADAAGAVGAEGEEGHVHSSSSLDGRVGLAASYRFGPATGRPATNSMEGNHRSYRRSRRRRRRTVLVVFKFGTNDSKGNVWHSTEAFAGNYSQLIKGLLPMSALRPSPSSSSHYSDSDSDATAAPPLKTRFVILLVSPTPSFPRPHKSNSFRKSVIGGIRAHRIATEVRRGVLRTAEELRRHMVAVDADGAEGSAPPPPSSPAAAAAADVSVHFYDLFADFLPFVAPDTNIVGSSSSQQTGPSAVTSAGGGAGGLMDVNIAVQQPYGQLFPLLLPPSHSSTEGSGDRALSSSSSTSASSSLALDRQASANEALFCQVYTPRRFTSPLVSAMLHDGVHPTWRGHAVMAGLVYGWLTRGEGGGEIPLVSENSNRSFCRME